MLVDINGLYELYNLVKDYIIGMERWGSSIIYRLENPRDLDIIIFCNTLEEKRKVSSILFTKNNITKICYHKYFKLTYNFCIMVVTVAEQEDYISKKLFGYQSVLREPLLDFKLVPLNFDKQLFLKNLYNIYNTFIEKISTMTRMDFNSLYVNKQWYHIYLAKLLFYDNVKNFNATQINNINILHECANNSEWKALISECKNWLIAITK